MGGNSGSWCPCALINRGEGDRKCLGEIMQAESTCGVCHALNLQRSFGNHWRIFKTAARSNDPVYDLEGSSAAFRITQHAGEKIDIEGAVIPAFTWAGGRSRRRGQSWDILGSFGPCWIWAHLLMNVTHRGSWTKNGKNFPSLPV